MISPTSIRGCGRLPSPQSDAMNEKTPNLQTQAAMKEARAMAIKRVPELAESAVGVESFPIGHKASVDDETRRGVPTVHDPVGGRTQGRGT